MTVPGGAITIRVIPPRRRPFQPARERQAMHKLLVTMGTSRRIAIMIATILATMLVAVAARAASPAGGPAGGGAKAAGAVVKESSAVAEGEHIGKLVDREVVAAATAKVFPALVRIHVVEAYYSEGRERKSESSGSGFIISPDGYVVTNHHVAGEAVRLTCTMHDREEIPAKLVGADAMADIAVLKLQPDKPRKFACVSWGDASALRVGDPVLAMGSPLSLSQSVTEGIVSNLALTMPRWDNSGADFKLDGEDVGSIVRWLAHDASIYPGNSGGPLVNMAGQVVGVNEINIGLSGAIPAGLAREVAERLIKTGHVSRAFFGFMFQPLFKDQKQLTGVIVSDVIKGAPADKVGIKSGDRLLRVEGADGRVVEANVHFAEEMPPLNLALSQLPIGKPAKVTLARGAKQLVMDVTPRERDRVLRKQKEFKPWGLTGRDLSFWTARDKKRPNTDGVLITSVRPGGPAGQAKPELRDGDIILTVVGKTIKDMSALTSLTVELRHKSKDDTASVLVGFERDGEQLLTRVDVGLKELDDPGQDVRKAWIPVATQVLTRELAKALGMPDQMGVRVTELYEDAKSSATMGLRVGDIIAALDDSTVDAGEPHDVEVFPTMVRQYKVGSEATLTVLRGGKKIALKGKLEARPVEAREMKRYLDHDFDFTARDAAYMDRIQKQWKDQPRGAFVESVDEGGWTALAGLQVGDLIMAIDGQPVTDAESVRQRLEAIKKQRPKTVVFKIRRDIQNLYLEVEPKWD
jgi:serine protease Do